MIMASGEGTSRGMTNTIPPNRTDNMRMFRWNIVMVMVLFVAIADAIRQGWVCDDAFLSFRYAEHFSSGKGLVFNDGEYVEGYSNFLWTVSLAVGMFCGASPEFLSMAMGIFFFSGTLLLCTRIGNGMVACCAVARSLAGC